jgi:hypothetical protein
MSVYENGSIDQTKALLRIFDALAISVGLRESFRHPHISAHAERLPTVSGISLEIAMLILCPFTSSKTPRTSISIPLSSRLLPVRIGARIHQ